MNILAASQCRLTEVESRSTLSIGVPAVHLSSWPLLKMIATTNHRACKREVSSLVFLLLLYLLRFLISAAWLALEEAVQGALLVFLISAGSACFCIASLVPGLDKSPFSRTRQGTCCHVSPWLFPSCSGSRRAGTNQWNNWTGGETVFLFPEGALVSPDGVQPRRSPSASAHVASLAC